MADAQREKYPRQQQKNLSYRFDPQHSPILAGVLTQIKATFRIRDATSSILGVDPLREQQKEVFVVSPPEGPGTVERAPSWAEMPPMVARSLRFLVVLALVIGGGASHDVAMAEKALIAAHVHAQHHDTGDQAARDACNSPSCEHSTPCCSLGHCLVAIMFQGDNGFALMCRPGLNGMKTTLLVGSLLEAPYRPPVSV